MLLKPEDPIEAGEDLINLSDVRDRIPHVKPWHVEYRDSDYEPAGVSPFASEADARTWIANEAPDKGIDPANLMPVVYDDEAEELSELTRLLAAMEEIDGGSNHTSAINTRYLETFVRDQAEDRYGADACASLAVDWDRQVANDTAEGREHTYRGQTFILLP
jgi:hypothetical protein